jgi:EpsI family protein
MRHHKRYFVVLAVLLSLWAFSVGYAPGKVPLKNNLGALAPDIDGWIFLGNIEMEERKHVALDPEALIFREYRSKSGQPLNLVVVYHQNDRWGAHDPMVCYTSQGWKVVESQTTVGIGNEPSRTLVNRFVVKREDVSYVVYYYWFSSNRKITHDRNRQMWDMVLNGILHGYTESGFVRVSMPLGSNQEKAISEIYDFTLRFMEVLKRNL